MLWLNQNPILKIYFHAGPVWAWKKKFTNFRKKPWKTASFLHFLLWLEWLYTYTCSRVKRKENKNFKQKAKMLLKTAINVEENRLNKKICIQLSIFFAWSENSFYFCYFSQRFTYFRFKLLSFFSTYFKYFQ